MPSQKKKAIVLYSSLDLNSREKIGEFLGSKQIADLIQGQKAGKKQEGSEKDFREINRALLSAKARKTNPENFFAIGFYSINLLGSFLALFQANYATAISCFLYAIAGYFYFSSRSITSVKIRFSVIPFEFTHLLFALGIYALILPLTGLLSINEVYRQKEISLLFQGIFLAPLFEEIFFRDLLFSYIKEISKSLWFTILFTGFFFSLLHLESFDDYAGLLVYFFSGSLLGWLRGVSKNLVYPVLVHSAVNTSLLFL